MQLGTRLLSIATVAALTGFITACNNTAPNTANDSQTTDTDIAQMSPTSQTESHIGKIVFKTFEGGFYAFESKDGARFTLIGMDKTHRQHGLIVEITGSPVKDMATTTQYGTPFKLSELKVLDDSQVSRPPESPEN